VQPVANKNRKQLPNRATVLNLILVASVHDKFALLFRIVKVKAILVQLNCWVLDLVAVFDSPGVDLQAKCRLNSLFPALLLYTSR
jgi:hypothetical protein